MKKFMLFILTTVLLGLNGCKKSEIPSTSTNSNHSSFQASIREGTQVSKAWLETFQSELRNAINGQLTGNTYSIEDMIVGTEALINLSLPSYQPSSFHQFSATRHSYSSNSMPLAGLFTNSYSFVVNQFSVLDSNVFKPLYVEISLDTIIHDSVYVKTTLAFGRKDQCVESQYNTSNSSIPCPALFPPGTYFRMGAGDEELDLQDFYWNNLPCESQCGSVPPCVNVEYPTAPEEIEATFNYNYPLVFVPVSPDPTKPYLIGWVDIDCENYINPSLLENLMYSHADCDIEFYDELTLGHCLDANELNCIYCGLWNIFAGNHVNIPAGRYLMSINLGVHWCPCGGATECDYKAYLNAKYCTGRPVFSRWKYIYGWDDPTTIDIDLGQE